MGARQAYLDGTDDPSGSTITQQTSKNLFLWAGRYPPLEPLRKALEILPAETMEIVMSKRRILEIYVNVAQFAPRVYGVCAASWYYFGKSSRSLSVDESAQLVGLLPSPLHVERAPGGGMRFLGDANGNGVADPGERGWISAKGYWHARERAPAGTPRWAGSPRPRASASRATPRTCPRPTTRAASPGRAGRPRLTRPRHAPVRSAAGALQDRGHLLRVRDPVPGRGVAVADLDPDVAVAEHPERGLVGDVVAGEQHRVDAQRGPQRVDRGPLRRLDDRQVQHVLPAVASTPSRTQSARTRSSNAVPAAGAIPRTCTAPPAGLVSSRPRASCRPRPAGRRAASRAAAPARR